MRTRILLAGILVALAAATAHAEYRAISFRLGDRITSFIEPVDDRDSFAFDGIEGTRVTFKVTAAKGTGLIPAVELLGSDGHAIDVSAWLKTKKQKVQLKKVPLPVTGRYVLRITSANGEGGAFTVTTKGKPPGSRSFKGVALATGATRAFAIPAESDATLKVTVKGKGQGCEVVSVTDPAGAEIPGGVTVFGQVGPSKKAKGTLSLAGGFGEYAITVGKAPEPTTLSVKLKLKFAKREAQLVEVPALEPNSAPIAKLRSIAGDVSGAISFPFTVQDPEGDTVVVYYKYGIDRTGDGEITAGDGEQWLDPTPVEGSAGTLLATEPWDEPVAYTFVWDSVRDIGSPGPDSGRRDIVFRVYPRDDAPGIADQITDFRIVLDPDGLYLVSWGPEGDDTLNPGVAHVGEVELNRPLVFHFSAAIAPGSATRDTLKIRAGTQAVSGYYDVDGKTVTFYPQVQEIPPRTDVLQPDTLYRVEIPRYYPGGSPHSTVLCAGGSSGDYSGWVCLASEDLPDAFATGDGHVEETGKPRFTSLDTPTTLTDVSVDTKVVLTLSEPIDPATFEYPSFQLVVVTANGYAVVPVSVTLRNVVGPPGVRKCVVTLTPRYELPPSATVRVILTGAIEDFAANSLVTATPSFTTKTGTPQGFTKAESFTSTTNRDEDRTTAHWGTVVSGRLTGFVEGGSGSDGALHVKSGTTTLWNNVYNFTTLTVEEGATLKFSTTKAVELLVKGDVTIKGTIDVSGARGADSQQVFYYQTKPDFDALQGAGGVGGPGGADGGSTAASLPTSSGGYTYDAGGDGKGAGAGKGGGIVSADSWKCRGGGGGGYGTSGDDGGDSGGEGGPTYGTATLTEMRGGSGGGGGSSRCYYYYGSPSDWYYRLSVGGGGGGGGGSIKIVTDSKIDLASTGQILSKGGDGGSPYLAGEGGGGSGGDVFLRAKMGILKNGLIDVRGGLGARDGYGYSETRSSEKAGDGGAGRIRLEEPEPLEQVVDEIGDFLTAVNTDLTDGGSLAGSDGKLDPDSDLTLTTSSSKSTWYFSEINVRSGVTVTVEGDRAARLLARDGITIRGVIRAEGGDGEDHEPWEKLTSGYIAVKGGKAGPGGYRGGRSHTVNGQVDPTKAEGGQGPGAGQGASVNLVTVNDEKRWHPGLGGGASHATKGGEDSRANSGEAGATYGSTSTMTHTSIQGGSGGGGGSNGKETVSQGSRYWQGGSGGGGGGALVLETPKTLTLMGRVSVKGGEGGSCTAYSGLWSGSGGGGSGGSALLRGGSFDIRFGSVDASGGEGGRGGWNRSIAGEGGKGRIKLESKSTAKLLTSNNIRTGSYSCAEFEPRFDTGVTIWFDAGSLSPTYKSLTSTVYPSDGSQTQIRLEVCHTDPATLGPDEQNVVQFTAAEVAAGKANGYRFYRFRIEFEPGDEDPYVDEVEVTGSIAKK